MPNREDLLKWSFATMLVGGLLTALGPFLGGNDANATWAYLVGGLILAAAAGVRLSPERATAWGTTSMVVGAFGIAAIGGTFLGPVVAIAGGALAVAADKGIGTTTRDAA